MTKRTSYMLPALFSDTEDELMIRLFFFCIALLFYYLEKAEMILLKLT